MGHIIPPTHTTHTFSLTSAQREIWFDQMLHADVPLYNIGGDVDIPGEFPFQPNDDIGHQVEFDLFMSLVETGNGILERLINAPEKPVSTLLTQSTADTIAEESVITC